MAKKCNGIRPFKVPLLNFEAQSICELSDLSDAKTEPPLTMKYSFEQLCEIISTPLSLMSLPCHTTACERGVQITTAAAVVSANTELQDGCSFNKFSAIKRNKNALKKSWKVE